MFTEIGSQACVIEVWNKPMFLPDDSFYIRRMCDDGGKKMAEVILTASFMTTAEQRHKVPKLEEGVLYCFCLKEKIELIT